ncbi:Lipoyl synthase [Lactarius pseudohatsudake]|nr:Lipoyl synthase [Lactarius pseudohatsudake]
MSTILKCSRFARVPISRHARALAIPATSESPVPKKNSFTETLADGPSLDDFVSGDVPERIVLGNKNTPRLPSYLKTSIPTGASFSKIKKDLRGLGLHTVCEEARCPNIGDCWGGKEGASPEESKRAATATIMLMGDTCTRGCRFCSVKTSKAPPPLDPHEPENTAEAISRWGLGYIVLTSVDRDGMCSKSSPFRSSQKIYCASRPRSCRLWSTPLCGDDPKDQAEVRGTFLRAEMPSQRVPRAPHTLVEALTGDMAGNLGHVSVVAKSGLDVYAHNIETVEALTPFVRDRRATFRQSLSVLERAKQDGVRVTKTSIMLGVGETEDQIMDALRELRKVDVDVVTFGQYMRPTKRHMKVDRYVEPAEFGRWKQITEDMGFLYVASGPLVRSSYKAGEYFIENVLRGKGAEKRSQNLVVQQAGTDAKLFT